jgi:branched-subunit amino acid aminotransferase/4-amino-4-deoxychorismate lyase
LSNCRRANVDVYGADELLFWTGITAELAAIVKIDNRMIGAGKVGSITNA